MRQSVVADTPFMRGALGGDHLPDENRAALISGIPLRRLTEPSDVAAAVTFLASDDAAFLTGVCLPSMEDAASAIRLRGYPATLPVGTGVAFASAAATFLRISGISSRP